jgi:hypothetical protein
MSDINENVSAGMPPATDDAAAPTSIWSIVGQVFTSPTKAFEAFRANPNWIVPLLLVVVMLGISSVMLAGYQAEMQYDMLKTGSLPPAALEQMREAADNPNYVTAPIGGVVFLVIFSLIQAGIALFLGKVIFAGMASFKQVWGVSLLSTMIFQVGALVRIPLAFAKDTMLVSLGPTALWPGGDFTSFMYVVAFSLDIFMIWSLVVGGIGYGVIFGIGGTKGQIISWLLGILFICLGASVAFFGLGFAGVETTFF